MAFSIDSLASTHHLVHGYGFPTPVMRLGDRLVRGSSYIEGPSVFGNPNIWPFVTATVMIGPNINIDSPGGYLPGSVTACGGWNHSPYSLHVIGDVAINNFLEVFVDVNVGSTIRAGKLIKSQGEVEAFCGEHKLSEKKNFDIPHPTREGWRLTHACLEGPEAAVYCRGRIRNSDVIKLPEYWENLVDFNTITVNLTEIGANQGVIIKRIDSKKIYLQSKAGIPINCFYYIMAERKDTEKLIPEYEGTIEDYPGDNNQRSIAGYHYDKKEVNYD